MMGGYHLTPKADKQVQFILLLSFPLLRLCRGWLGLCQTSEMRQGCVMYRLQTLIASEQKFALIGLP